MKLVTTIDQLRKGSAITISHNIANFAPYIEEAEDTFIRPAIGEDAWALFTDMAADGSGSGGEDLTDAFDLCQKATSLYALWCGADELAISLNVNGFQVSNNQNFKPAASYQIANLKESWMRRAHIALEGCLKKISSLQIDNEKTLYDLLIGCEEDFSRHVNINNSRRVYLLLRPYIRNIEQKYIIPAITQGLYDYLLGKYAENTYDNLEADEKDLINKIHPALAHLSMARALKEISIDKLDWGVFEMSNSTFQRISDRGTVNRDRVERMIQVCEADGEAEMTGITNFLNANASESKYADYFTSDLYQSADDLETEAADQVTRNTDSGILIM